jgi:cytochrome c oxidase subunit 2
MFILAVLGLGLLAACGGDDADPVPTATSAAAEPTATTEAAPPADETGGDAEAGRQVAAQCMACHTTDGSTGVGPTWQGLYGSEVTLADGSTVTADEEYIRESIVDPGAKVHEGFAAGVMPDYSSILSEQQIDDVVAYIISLQ